MLFGVDLAPDINGLPGGALAQQFANGIAAFSLLFVVIGLVLSGGMWAIGAFSNNYTQSVNGKKGFLICAGAAIAIGGAAQLVNWFSDAGSKINEKANTKN